MSPGPTQILMILLVVALLFGGRRIAGLGKDLGKGLRGFKDGLAGSSDDDAAEPDVRTTGGASASSKRASPGVDAT